MGRFDAEIEFVLKAFLAVPAEALLPKQLQRIEVAVLIAHAVYRPASPLPKRSIILIGIQRCPEHALAFLRRAGVSGGIVASCRSKSSLPLGVTVTWKDPR